MYCRGPLLLSSPAGRVAGEGTVPRLDRDWVTCGRLRFVEERRASPPGLGGVRSTGRGHRSLAPGGPLGGGREAGEPRGGRGAVRRSGRRC